LRDRDVNEHVRDIRENFCLSIERVSVLDMLDIWFDRDRGIISEIQKKKMEKVEKK